MSKFCRPITDAMKYPTGTILRVVKPPCHLPKLRVGLCISVDAPVIRKTLDYWQRKGARYEVVTAALAEDVYAKINLR